MSDNFGAETLVSNPNSWAPGMGGHQGYGFGAQELIRCPSGVMEEQVGDSEQEWWWGAARRAGPLRVRGNQEMR